MIAGLQRNGVAGRLPLFNFGMIKGKQREVNFAAVQAGMGRNYKPMQEIFRRVVQASN
jgi:hypothetical protein